MHLLIVGASGQLGRALVDVCAGVDRLTLWTRPDHDIADPRTADDVTDLAPDVVINAAAWTHVDGAEAQPDAAYAANALGPLYLATGCARCGADLVQVSSNEVFAGEDGRFYREYDGVQPGSVYARSKAAGERAAIQVWNRVYIVRAAWIYGPGGNNFPSKIVQAADRHGALRVVADEYGNPTYAPDLAAAILRLVKTQRYGNYHLVNEGHASRFEWAVQLLYLSGRGDIPVTPISAHEWPRPSMPPSHAVLVNQAGAALGVSLRPWQDALAEYFRVETSLLKT